MSSHGKPPAPRRDHSGEDGPAGIEGEIIVACSA
jgi:hypothetical protein